MNGTTEAIATRPVVNTRTEIMPSAADVLAVAEHYGVAFVEVDGWVNALVGSTVYKAPTASAVS